MPEYRRWFVEEGTTKKKASYLLPIDNMPRPIKVEIGLE